jgi:hypothetical protein
VPTDFFGKKIEYSFILCKFEKEASKKEKIAKVLKPRKFEKKRKKTLPIKDIFHFYL